MPTYEYKCDACKKSFEVEQRISEAPLKKCPKCGKNKVRRMISQGNFILKGSGWYSDLYSGPSNQESAGKKKKTDSKKKSGKSDSNQSTAKKASSLKPKEKSA